MSPTDAMVSPCTQKLMGSRRYLRKMAATTGWVYTLKPNPILPYPAFVNCLLWFCSLN